MVLDPAALIKERDTLEAAGYNPQGRLFISNRAHLIFPHHRELEKAAEAALGEHKIGTTARGIGPAYEDKMGRRGLRVCDLLDAERFKTKFSRLLDYKIALARALYGNAGLDKEKVRKTYCGYAELVWGVETLVEDRCPASNVRGEPGIGNVACDDLDPVGGVGMAASIDCDHLLPRGREVLDEGQADRAGTEYHVSRHASPSVDNRELWDAPWLLDRHATFRHDRRYSGGLDARFR